MCGNSNVRRDVPERAINLSLRSGVDEYDAPELVLNCDNTG